MAKAPTKKPTKKPAPKPAKKPAAVKQTPKVEVPAKAPEERRWAFNPTRALTPVEITDLFRLLNLTVKGQSAYDKLDPDVAPLFVEVE
jgi:hypothetical protein